MARCVKSKCPKNVDHTAASAKATDATGVQSPSNTRLPQHSVVKRATTPIASESEDHIERAFTTSGMPMARRSSSRPVPGQESGKLE